MYQNNISFEDSPILSITYINGIIDPIRHNSHIILMADPDIHQALLTELNQMDGVSDVRASNVTINIGTTHQSSPNPDNALKEILGLFQSKDWLSEEQVRDAYEDLGLLPGFGVDSNDRMRENPHREL